MTLEGFVPILDGEELTRSDTGELHHPDGRPVDAERLEEIVWLNRAELDRLSESGGFRALDDDGAFAPIDPDEPDDDSAGLGFSGSDVRNLLLTLADAHSAELPIEVDAGFFHRTLVRWMGLAPDDDTPAGRAPLWDYGFWKAEIHEEGPFEPDAAPASARVSSWSAVVWRGEGAPPERFRYWVAFDEHGRIAASRWLTAPPDLLGDPEPGGAFAERTLDHDLVERLLSEPDA